VPYLTTPNERAQFYTVDGEGPTAVFVHGGFMNHRIWERQRTRFAENYRVVTVDLPGHGRSEPADETHTVELFAEALGRVLEETGTTDGTLVGWSLGATVATAYLGGGGDRIERAVLLSSGIFAGVAGEGSRLDFDALLTAHRTRRPEAMMEFVTGLFAEEPSEHTARWLWSLGMDCPMHVDLDVLRIYATMEYDAVEEALAGADLPVAVFQGAHDGAASLDDAAYVAREVLPHGRFVPFHDSGHLPFLEEPERFDDELEKFLRG